VILDHNLLLERKGTWKKFYSQEIYWVIPNNCKSKFLIVHQYESFVFILIFYFFFLGVILSFGIDQSLNFTKKKKGTKLDGYKQFRAQRLIETSLTNWRYKTFGDMKLWTKLERERERCEEAEEEAEEEEEEKVLWIHLTWLKLGVFLFCVFELESI
jgi:hypothetical protein